MIQQVLIAQIESDATLLAAFGRRIYPVVLPNRVQFPAIVYYVPTMPISHTMQGAGTIDQATVHLIVYADTYLEAWAAANVLRAALDGQAGTWGDTAGVVCLLDDMGDAPALVAENEAAVAWGVRLDFTIQFEE